MRDLHENMVGRVMVSKGETTEAFPITTGVKQGCVLAPTLLDLFFASMLSTCDFSNCADGVYIRFRIKLFDLRKFNSKTNTIDQLVSELLYADDCALVSYSEAGLQDMANAFSAATKRFALTISIKKTEIVFQPTPNNPFQTDPTILID